MQVELFEQDYTSINIKHASRIIDQDYTSINMQVESFLGLYEYKHASRIIDQDYTSTYK